MSESVVSSVPPFKNFDNRPTDADVKSVVGHIDRTGHPETFPGIHQGPISKSEEFLILARFDIPRTKRNDGKNAPCPMCHQANKYLDGRLVYFPKLQAMAAIGHCCADSENNRLAEKLYKREREIERANNLLLDEIPNCKGRLEKAEKLIAVAAEVDRVHRNLKGSKRYFQMALRKATMVSDQLSVDEIIGKSQFGGPAGLRAAGSSIETRPVNFGILKGVTAVSSNLNLKGDLDPIVELLRENIAEGDDAVLDHLDELDDDAKIALGQSLEKAIFKISEIEDKVQDFRRFFAKDNLQTISEWGAHRDNETPMNASMARRDDIGGRCHFEMVGGPNKVRIIIEDVMWAAA